MLLQLARTSLVFIMFICPLAKAADKVLDPSLKPEQDRSESLPQVFRDVVVVQNKAKEKSGSFLFNSFGNFDFSDGPTTMYGLNLDFGYALSDYWEIYANYVPYFLDNERKVISLVRQATNGSAQIVYSKALSQYGGEILWAPAYGKDSWGPYTIVRSDTYLKLGIAQVSYDQGNTGMRYSISIGKTFFIAPGLNLRMGAGGSFIQIPVQGALTYYTIGIMEAGFVWYM